MHPAVVYIPKYAMEDTWLPDDPDNEQGGEGKRVFVPKGTECGIDTVGLREYPCLSQDFTCAKLLPDSQIVIVGLPPIDDLTITNTLSKPDIGRIRMHSSPSDSWRTITEMHLRPSLPGPGVRPFFRQSLAKLTVPCTIACIGRKFAEVEMVAVLSLLVRTYEILPLATPDPSGIDVDAEPTHEATLPNLLTEKILETKPGVTLTPRDIGVRLVRRREGAVSRPEE